jgi:hypothetical protein
MTQIIQGFNDAATLATVEGAAPVLAPKSRKDKLAERIATLTKRISADTVALADAQAQFDSVDRLSNIAEGSQVTIRIGRAETSKEVQGVITGIKEEDNGSRRFKVYYGSGFDADTVVIQESQILDVLANPAIG